MYKMLCVSNFTVSMYDALARHKQRVDDPALADIFIASNSYCDSGEKNWPLYGISLTTRRSRSMARAHFPPPHRITNSSSASVLTTTCHDHDHGLNRLLADPGTPGILRVQYRVCPSALGMFCFVTMVVLLACVCVAHAQAFNGTGCNMGSYNDHAPFKALGYSTLCPRGMRHRDTGKPHIVFDLRSDPSFCWWVSLTPHFPCAVVFFVCNDLTVSGVPLTLRTATGNIRRRTAGSGVSSSPERIPYPR